MTSDNRDTLARDALTSYLEATRGEIWISDPVRPDEVIRDRPAYDYHLREEASKREAALEVTTYDWPMDRTTLYARLGSLAQILERELVDSLVGWYSLGVNMNIHESRAANRATLREWLAEHGNTLPVGKSILMPGVSGVDVMKLTDEGPLKITLTASRTSIEYPEWMDDLEVVMEENARKFDGLGATARRWLLVIYPGISGKFEITGPTLALPQSVDELSLSTIGPRRLKASSTTRQ